LLQIDGADVVEHRRFSCPIFFGATIGKRLVIPGERLIVLFLPGGDDRKIVEERHLQIAQDQFAAKGERMAIEIIGFPEIAQTVVIESDRVKDMGFAGPVAQFSSYLEGAKTVIERLLIFVQLAMSNGLFFEHLHLKPRLAEFLIDRYGLLER